jgi:predicted nuclease with TOPRIM domain
MSIRGVFYNRINDEKKVQQIGVIAQELEPVVPQAVTYCDINDEYGVSYGNLAGLFIEAIKEQQQTINKQSEEIKELNAKNDSLRLANKVLKENIMANEKLLTSSDIKIQELKKEDENLKSKVKTLNNNISNLKQNYEKANSHSNNFSTIDIERYFADSLDIR